MKSPFARAHHLPTRTRWLIWSATVLLWLAVWIYPVSDRLTRLAGVVLLAAAWVALIVLLWHRRKSLD